MIYDRIVLLKMEEKNNIIGVCIMDSLIVKLLRVVIEKVGK